MQKNMWKKTNMWRQIFEVKICSRLDDSEELMEEGRLAGLDGTIMQVLTMITMPIMMMEIELEKRVEVLVEILLSLIRESQP